MPRVLASRISFSAIMRRIFGMLDKHRTRNNRTRQKKVTALIRESRRREIISKRDELAVASQLIAGLFAKFSQCDCFDLFLVRFEHVVDLTGRHFPNRLANRHAFLMNEDNLSLASHRRDNDGCFTMYHRPLPWSRMRRCSHLIGHNFNMRVSKLRIARDCFPAFAFVHEIAALHAGRL